MHDFIQRLCKQFQPILTTAFCALHAHRLNEGHVALELELGAALERFVQHVAEPEERSAEGASWYDVMRRLQERSDEEKPPKPLEDLLQIGVARGHCADEQGMKLLLETVRQRPRQC